MYYVSIDAIFGSIKQLDNDGYNCCDGCYSNNGHKTFNAAKTCLVKYMNSKARDYRNAAKQAKTLKESSQ